MFRITSAAFLQSLKNVRRTSGIRWKTEHDCPVKGIDEARISINFKKWKVCFDERISEDS